MILVIFNESGNPALYLIIFWEINSFASTH